MTKKQKALELSLSTAYKIVIHTLQDHMGYNSDIDTQNMKDSALRSARGFLDLIKPLEEIQREIRKQVRKRFDTNDTSMVTVQNVIVTSMCPHHFLPVVYRITMSYLPYTGGRKRVIGLSKPARIAELLAARPVLQETLATDIGDVLAHNFAEDPQFPGIKSSGCGVVVEGLHMCMACRGVRQHGARAIIQKLHGAYMENPMVREEFMAIFQSNRPQNII